MIHFIYSFLLCHHDCFMRSLSCAQINSYAANHKLLFFSEALQFLLQLLQQWLRPSHQQEDRASLQQMGHLDNERFVCLLAFKKKKKISASWSLTSCASACPNPFEAPVMIQMPRPKVLGFLEWMSDILSNFLWSLKNMWKRAHCFCQLVRRMWTPLLLL